MPDIIPKRNSWLAWIIMIIIIIGGFLLFKPESVELLSIRPLYTIVIVLLLGLWIWASWYWLKTLSEAAYEFWSGRILIVAVITIAICAWTWGWSSQRRQDKQATIEYNGK